MQKAVFWCALALAGILGFAEAAAQGTAGNRPSAKETPVQNSWAQEKCRRYQAAYTGLLARRGEAEIGAGFLREHAAFIASGCTARANVCPRSAAEIGLANDLTVLAMNFGAASTFLPFSCR